MVWELLELVEKAWECVFGAWCFISSTLWMRMMFLEKNSFASDVIWTANEFGSAFDADEFEVNFVVVFQTHVHAFFNNNSNWNFVFPSCILFLEAVRMFEDVFGRFWNLSTRCGWTTFIFVWKWIQTYWIHPTLWWEVWEERLFCACRRCHFNSTEQLKQEKTNLCMLHVQDNLAGQTACLFPLCFLCGKGTEGIAVKPSWIWVVFCSYARRGVKPTQFDASARY